MALTIRLYARASDVPVPAGPGDLAGSVHVCNWTTGERHWIGPLVQDDLIDDYGPVRAVSNLTIDLFRAA